MRFLRLGPIATFTIYIVTIGILILFDATLTDSDRTKFFYVMSQSKTCEHGSKIAKLYFDKGNYLLIFFGLPDGGVEIVGEVLESDYGIVQRYGGCAGPDEIYCYTKTMYSLLQQKYGTEFYLNARKKAAKIYSR